MLHYAKIFILMAVIMPVGYTASKNYGPPPPPPLTCDQECRANPAYSGGTIVRLETGFSTCSCTAKK